VIRQNIATKSVTFSKLPACINEMMDDDAALIRRYAEENSETAFSEIVAKYINLVYSTAQRRVCSHNLAEEVTQAVFIILARKARSLDKKTVLPGWLCRTAQYVAGRALTIERQRKRREHEAHMQSVLNESEPDVWPHIAPLLDLAMEQLREKDHDALTLRFFEGKSMAEIGTALGASEDAAKMRVNRALEKLRKFFNKRGVTLTAAAIGGSLSMNSVQAAPAALAQSVAAVAIAKSTVAASTLNLVNGVWKAMAWTKAKTAIVTGIIVLLGAGVGSVALFHDAPKAESDTKRDSVVVTGRTTPKSTLVMMSRAMATADAQSYVENYTFTTAEEIKLKASLERLVSGNGQFRQALADKFGEAAANSVFPNLPFVIPEDVIKSATENIEGATATVAFSGGKGGRPIQFKKIDSEWKMAADGFWHLSPAVMTDILGRVIKALDETAGEIPSGKYNTALEAVDAMKQKGR
jgi:RNA polymerase sigma factor (sigma-70 family)